MPIIFYLFGKKIRAKSKFAPAPDIAQDKRRDEEARLGDANLENASGESTDGDAPKDKKEE